jgi:hypothetical protein
MPFQVATGRTTFAGIDPDYGDDSDHDDEDDLNDDVDVDVDVDYDDMAPLVVSSTMSPLELEHRRRQPTFPSMSGTMSCCGIRIFLLLLLGVLLVPVLFHGHQKGGGGGSHTSDEGSGVTVNSEHDHEPSAPVSIRKPVLVDTYNQDQETSAPTAMTTRPTLATSAPTAMTTMTTTTRPTMATSAPTAMTTTTTTRPTIVVAQDDEATMTLEAAERASVVAGCEPEHSFNQLIYEMEELEQFAPELCGKVVRTIFLEVHATLHEKGGPSA